MGNSKKQQLADELGKEMAAVVNQENIADDHKHYDVYENELDRKRAELKEVKSILNKTRYELTKNNRRLERLDNECQEAKKVADMSVRIIKKQLFKLLSKRSQHKVELFISFYHQEDQMNLLDAMMSYVMTGKKTKFDRAVAQWHFRLFCEMVDDDRVTVPSHELLKRLWIKVGLLQRIEVDEVKY